ncbi:hypothetical protein ZIOFF_061895 [Zingiber officinale]|uniref:DUF547 domain-containing protein n=1 Tax=Zingiber officinale TaxID=94328 RepID=A0A8J5KDX8_ZINOF|nr:hypothetical protein ZIOFF_061895 [Zingiber officinale]
MEFEEKPDDRIHSRHSRSDSDSVNRRNKGYKLDPLPGSVRHAKLVTEQPTDNKEMTSKSSPEADGQGSLKHEILQLEKRLKDQLTIRCALEKALGHSSSAMCSSNDSSMPKASGQINGLDTSFFHSLFSDLIQCFYFALLSANDVDSGMMSLAEYLGSPTADQIPDTPNKLSEDMVRCMATVYCKLADPPLISQTFFSSSSSTTTSTIPGFSPQHLGEPWSPSKTEELKEFSTTVEIPHISENHKDVEDLLCNFKLILHQLDKVDPSKLKNDQKLAFWINVYNAIIMHAYIEHGIPEGGAKKTSLLIKAMCTIGGRSINAFMIQSFIFEGKTKSTTQWLRRMLLNPRSKYKDVDKRRNYAIEHSEPLLYFALSSGSHSDPPVRIYNSSRILKQLKVAKEEYIRSNVEIWKDQKILLPKLIDLYAKDSKLSSQKLVEMLQNNLPQNLKLALQRCQRFNKPIEWIPHNPQFRYLLSREFVFPQVN